MCQDSTKYVKICHDFDMNYFLTLIFSEMKFSFKYVNSSKYFKVQVNQFLKLILYEKYD